MFAYFLLAPFNLSVHETLETILLYLIVLQMDSSLLQKSYYSANFLRDFRFQIGKAFRAHRGTDKFILVLLLPRLVAYGVHELG